MTTQPHSIVGHSFLAGLPPALIAPLTAHADRVVLPAGKRLFAEGGSADRFWLIEDGEIGLDIQVPGRGAVVIETLGRWTVLGWSWLEAPYRWHFGAVVRRTTWAIEVDAAAVRRLLEADPVLGYALTRRFLGVVVDRLQATRLRLLDLYAVPDEVRT